MIMKYFDKYRKPIKKIDNRWMRAIDVAQNSRATPLQSGYHVNTGAVTRKGLAIYGSNHEIGITNTTTHGEEAVISFAQDYAGENDPIQVIAFIGQDGIPSPCGNCRDAIRQYIDLENLVIIQADIIKGAATVVDGKDYYFDDFRESDLTVFTKILSSQGLKKALEAEKKAFDIYLNPKTSPKIYGVAIVAGDAVFQGGFLGDVAYHPIYPGSAAISNFWYGSDDPKRKNVDEIIIASSRQVPYVQYKDRQHLLQFAQGIQALNGSLAALPVYLVRANDVPLILATDTEEWLPYPFSPNHLGLQEKVMEGYGKLFK